MKKSIVLLFVCLICYVSGYAQGIIKVDPLTGSAMTAIPVYTISNGQVSVPITLSYISNVKALDVEGSAGMGWTLNAGGKVTRQVRGIPDDIMQDTYGNARYGWMSSANQGADSISNFHIQNTGPGNCPGEVNDVTTIAAHFPYYYDTEPDIFYVSAPGLSCQLIYRRDLSKFVPMNGEDVAIATSPGTPTGPISAFTITNDKGIKYVFSTSTIVTETADTTGAASPNFFTTYFKQYQKGITYNVAWNLTSITDQMGNAINFTYTSSNTRGSRDPVNLYLPSTGSATLQYTIQQVTVTPLLGTISSNNPNATANNLTLYWTSSSSTNEHCIQSIIGTGRTFNFHYSDVFSPHTTYSRLFLRSYSELGCTTPVNYSFAYGQEIQAPNESSYTTILPDSLSFKIDYWGYPLFSVLGSLAPKVLINPALSTSLFPRYAIYNTATGGGSYAYSTSGNDRSANTAATCNVGNLTGITYIGGGKTTIQYEPNTYVDIPSNKTISGGGIRVKNVTDHDGIDSTKNIVRSYTYADSTGVTSGRPITLPAFAFTIPYSGSATGQSLWDLCTVTSDYDLSGEDHTIVYSNSQVAETGLGSTWYQYYLPATYWDLSAHPGCYMCNTADWTPTTDLISRGTCTAVYGPIKNDIYSYPFVPNLNYDNERGLLKKMTNFNDSGTEVSESNYTYKRSSAPSTITAFQHEDISYGSLPATAYNKYPVYVNYTELVASESKKVFDSPIIANAHSTTVNYTYGTAHKLPIQQSITNSDGSTLITNIRYVKDYNVSLTTNQYINALYYLKQANINWPVETWQQVKRLSDTVTTAASLTKYSSFTGTATTFNLPAVQKSFVSSQGLTGFIPYYISGATDNANPNYQTTANYDTYDNYGYSQTTDDGSKNYKTAIVDHNTDNVTAAISNAQYNEVGFSDFDTDIATPQSCNFSISGTGFAPVGSHAGNAYGLNTGQTISKTIGGRNIKASNYIFSVWVNAPSGGTITVSVTTNVTQTKTIAVSAGWKYYEVNMPVGGSSSTLLFSASCNTSISVDDLLLYPDLATVGTSSYDPISGYLLAETNTNGISAYYTRDKWGRLLLQYDQDKNIVHKTSYFTPADIALTLNKPDIYGGLTPNTGIPTTMNAFQSSECIVPVTYTWNFGDGTPPVSGVNAYIQTHTYASPGTDTVKVTVSHPTLGSKTASAVVVVTNLVPTLTVSVCQSGVKHWNNNTHTAVTTVSCPPNPNDAFNSYYTATITGAVGTPTYTWQISYNNGTSWSTYSTGSINQLTVPCHGVMMSYDMRCLVTTTGGQSVTSSPALSFSALP